MRPAWDEQQNAALDVIKARLGGEIEKAAAPATAISIPVSSRPASGHRSVFVPPGASSAGLIFDTWTGTFSRYSGVTASGAIYGGSGIMDLVGGHRDDNRQRRNVSGPRARRR